MAAAETAIDPRAHVDPAAKLQVLFGKSSLVQGVAKNQEDPFPFERFFQEIERA